MQVIHVSASRKLFGQVTDAIEFAGFRYVTISWLRTCPNQRMWSRRLRIFGVSQSAYSCNEESLLKSLVTGVRIRRSGKTLGIVDLRPKQGYKFQEFLSQLVKTFLQILCFYMLLTGALLWCKMCELLE